MSKNIQLNNDEERYNLLKDIQDIISSSDEGCNIFTEDLLIKLEKYFVIFSKLKSQKDYATQIEEHQTKEYAELFKKAKMFVNHYLLTMSMAIERGELPLSVINFYNISFPYCPDDEISADEFVKFSENIFSSDAGRIAAGGKYFANPSIGAVKVWVEKFVEAHNQKTNKYNVKRGEVENIDKIRQDCDCLILELNQTIQKSVAEEAYSYDEIIINLAEKPDENCYKADEEISSDTSQNTTKSKSGNDGINQLKFDLFFPE